MGNKLGSVHKLLEGLLKKITLDEAFLEALGKGRVVNRSEMGKCFR